MSDIATDAGSGSGERVHGVVEVEGERINYELHVVDARTDAQRKRDSAHGRPDGHIVVLLPGHGQTASGPRKLIATTAQLCRSKIVWVVDVTPSAGGDPTEGRALAKIVRERMAAEHPVRKEGARNQLPVKATLVGWSHGGGEALLAAGADPELFPQVLALCPTDLVRRPVWELIGSFVLEALRILGRSMRKGDWRYVRDAFRVGCNALVGLVRDGLLSRSLRTLIKDLRWATKKIPGRVFDYPGEVVLLFGCRDTVIRWRDLFPDCEQPDQIADYLDDFRFENFPKARRVEVRVVEGDHLGPEADATSHVRPGLELLGQLDEDEVLTLAAQAGL